MDTSDRALPVESVNFHVWQPCNMRCRFCFARFKDVRRQVLPAGHLPAADALRVVELLAEAGFRKVNFAGGEPFLCPWLPELLTSARRHGMVTSVVTNGSLVTADGLTALADALDWLVLSVDSLSPAVLAGLGRVTAGRALTEEEYLDLCRRTWAAGISLKINTVVTRLNLHEDLGPFLLTTAPRRWKVLQMLPVTGQNSRDCGPLAVTGEEFGRFVLRHRWVSQHGVEVVPEDNDAMTGSYAMLDPAGRFFDNMRGSYSYSRSVLECGVRTALEQVTVDRAKFLARGGRYHWERPRDEAKPVPGPAGTRPLSGG
ncbi:radical SAM protein [Streptomyces carminius]|uniref:S-adenosylmethionine-dependent nucleotide dehydratase n=1 Tax=Streptomyces carminius TaxID=2665496 RepID=A0A2M8LQY8_9ACTN|nr:viperin family antiviral radical SAM protein [Streptomyces carminius]PJE94368.1 radical SAM protein [Streptomyces carminius]